MLYLEYEYEKKLESMFSVIHSYLTLKIPQWNGTVHNFKNSFKFHLSLKLKNSE